MSQRVACGRGGLLALGALGVGLLLLALALWPPPAGHPDREDLAELRWLEERSLLYQARRAAATVSGRGAQWRHPYAKPQPRQAVRHASVWLLDYPASVITRPGQSVLATWGAPQLWDALSDLGVDLLHTGPLNRAGGVEGARYTPTLDGWFDRIADPRARSWSGWSASGPVRGADGRLRRWVYLHYFKPSQPALNWLDPSFAAQRAVAGDVVRTVLQRRTRVVRLDAVPFLGLEPKPGTTETLHYQHPLSVAATNYLAFLVRKLGGWSFHELNVPLESLKRFTRDGPDLSYDFFTRAQCLHALLTGDAGPLRLSFRWLLEAGVQPVALVHDLQNHDEITYQLVEPDHRKGQTLAVGKERLTGKQLRDRMLGEMRARVAGPAPPTTSSTAPSGTASPPPSPASSPRPSASATRTAPRRSRCGSSAAATCCWRRPTPSSRGCSACPAGTWWGRCPSPRRR
jgi:hypothetical protein